MDVVYEREAGFAERESQTTKSPDAFTLGLFRF